MRSHKDLDVWKRSMNLTLRIDRATEEFPKCEMFGLTSQMRRSAASIPANIAEGAARQHTKELMQFLRMSLGSAAELGFLEEKGNFLWRKPRR